jgi:hypothetical protein
MINRLVSVAILCLFAGSAFAGDPASNAPPAEAVAKPNETAAVPPSAPVDMGQAAVGDHWTYDLTDEISGEVKARTTATITEISSNNVTIRTERVGADTVGIIVYDNSWNVVRSGAQRFSPNDGSGIELPLEVGKTWKIRSDRIESTGAIWKKEGESKITGKEKITTKAGEFDAFVIETKFSAQNVNDRSRKTESTVRTWFSPNVNHWVKRSTEFHVNGHLLQNYVIELTSYGRKKA